MAKPTIVSLKVHEQTKQFMLVPRGHHFDPPPGCGLSCKNTDRMACSKASHMKMLQTDFLKIVFSSESNLNSKTFLQRLS